MDVCDVTRHILDSLLHSRPVDNVQGAPCSSLDQLIVVYCKASASDTARGSLPAVNPGCNVWYRRINRRRLQAQHAVSEGDATLAFVYESTSLFKPMWLLRRIKLLEDDDEEYYWKDWHPSLDQAENDYVERDTDISLDDILKIKEQLQSRVSSSPSSSCASTCSDHSASTAITLYDYSDIPKPVVEAHDDYWSMYDDYL